MQVSENVPELVKAPVDCVPLIAFVPSHAPDAAHPVALVDDQVSVELAPFATACGLAEIVTVGVGAFTVTVADCKTLPPVPVQVSENVPEVVNAPVDCVPLVAFVPSHAPEAVHPVALVDDQVSVELAPFAMFCGLALIVTVGCGATVTLADCETPPPLPVQLKMKVLVLVRAPVDCEPLVALAPDQAPEAVHPVASVDDQVSVELAPFATICGFALIVTVGGGDGGVTVTVTDCGTLPPAPVQVSEKVLVLVSTPVDCVPWDALAPDHAPDAVQLSAANVDQVSVEEAPLATDAGSAASDTVGADEA